MDIPISLIERTEQRYGDGGDDAFGPNRLSWEGLSGSDLRLLDARRSMLASRTCEPLVNAFERLQGKSDLLPINYLQQGFLQGQSVCRIKYLDVHSGRDVWATGFLVSPELLLTNRHVFFAEAFDDVEGVMPPVERFERFVKEVVLEFDVQRDVHGNLLTPVSFCLEPRRFLLADRELDMCLVAVGPYDRTESHRLSDRGYLVLNAHLGKSLTAEFASIIQHPDGGEKQIAIRQNQILGKTSNRIRYRSDTAPGSSGAPVFNDQWQVIALHSSGRPLKSGNQYLDRNREVIERAADGTIDESRLVWLDNEGVRISSIMAFLSAQRSPLAPDAILEKLFVPEYSDRRALASVSAPATSTGVVPTPSDTPFTQHQQPVVNISITVGPPGVTELTGPEATAATTASIDAAPAQHPGVHDAERFESALDYSSCKGFDEHFLGVYVPMPKPSAKLLAKLSRLKSNNNAFVVKYHHYSAMQHAVRKVPVVSALNVASAAQRFELPGRDDNWFRDNRIDDDEQLSNKWYSKSGFDRGHLARREDAEWGSDLAQARLAADLTCSYTNAVPQVPPLNRANKRGKWGLLEKELLEKGVRLESGKAGRICVFSGPLFKESDQVRVGVQVAVDFYKVVVWYDESGDLKTTCYRLSQKKLIGSIDFEVLNFEAVFVDEQVPIREIERGTGLTFHERVTEADTHAARPAL